MIANANHEGFVPRLEKIWLAIGGAMLVIFIMILLISAISMGAAPPSSMDMVDPQSVLVKGEFATPALVKTGPLTYTAHMAAYTFGFSPSTMTVPVGAKVTFRIATHDVVHGFEIPGTDVNVMVIPGYVSEVSHTFTKAGTYLALCNEFCGIGHQYMFMTITVK